MLETWASGQAHFQPNVHLLVGKEASINQAETKTHGETTCAETENCEPGCVRMEHTDGLAVMTRFCVEVISCRLDAQKVACLFALQEILSAQILRAFLH